MIVTLDEIKEYLKIDPLDTTHDNFLNRWNGICQGLVEEFCNQRFEVVSITDEITDGTGEKVLYVKNLPIVSVTSIKYTTDYVNWQDFDGEIVNDRYAIYSTRKFPKGNANFKVTYSAGWQEPPKAIKRVIIEMVAQAWSEGPGLGLLNTGNVGITAGGSTSRSFRDVLIQRHFEILKEFRIQRAI